MRRILIVLSLGVLAALIVQAPSRAQQAKAGKPAGNAASLQYEVLNPWAEVDSIPVRGISPRLNTLAGKKIGLFANFKRAARPMAAAVEKRLKERFPGIETILFDSRAANVNEIETENREKFIAWAKGVDAAIALVGD
jgi:hypothetical protein